MNKKYIVTIREVWKQGVEIEATNPEEAIERVLDGEGDQIESLLEYSHTLDSETWTIEEKKQSK